VGNRLSNTELANSPVVANRDMNRQRGCTGVNSYERELRFDPMEWLTERQQSQKSVAWLDLCCGEANALGDAASLLPTVEMTGIDLVDFFNIQVSAQPNVKLLVGNLLEVEFQERFDLITCVHGMHYVGDKLEAVFKYAAILKPGGRMIANLDTRDLCDRDGNTLARRVNRLLRRAGCECDTRHKLIRLSADVTPFRFDYLGADDRMGPNYTKQNTVASFYDLCGERSSDP
jgi:SAM-dependent methyltransferase